MAEIIKFNTDDIHAISKSMSQANKKAKSAMDYLNKANNSASWKCPERDKKIRPALEDAQREIKKLYKRVEEYAAACSKTAAAFDQAEADFKKVTAGTAKTSTQKTSFINRLIGTIKSMIDVFWSKITNNPAQAVIITVNPFIGVAGLIKPIVNHSDTILDIIKKSRKGIKSVGDLVKLLTSNDTLKKTLKENKIFQSLNFISNADKIVKILKGDRKELDKMIEKGGTKAIEKLLFSSIDKGADGYASIAWTFGNHLLDIDKFEYSPTGFAQYLWHCTGWTMIHTGSKKAFDIVDGLGGIVGYDVNKVYKDLTGVEGVEGFYKAAGDLANELWGDYYKNGSIGGIAKGTSDLVIDSLSWWGSSVPKLFKR